MNEEKKLEVRAEKIATVSRRVWNVLFTSGIPVVDGCYALLATLTAAMQGSKMTEADKRAIAMNTAATMVEEFLPEEREKAKAMIRPILN